MKNLIYPDAFQHAHRVHVFDECYGKQNEECFWSRTETPITSLSLFSLCFFYLSLVVQMQ